MADNIVRLPMDYFGNPDKGVPISNGFIYVGEPDFDPELLVNRKTLRLREEDGTEVPIAPDDQPVEIGAGGYVLYNGSPVQILVEDNYSIKVLDKNSAQKFYVPNVYDGVPALITDVIAGDAAVTAAFEAADTAVIAGYQAADSAVTVAFEAADALIEADVATNTADIATNAAGILAASAGWVGWYFADGFYTETVFNATSEDSGMLGVFFKPDGTKMYMIGFAGDAVYQFTLSIPWDLSTVSYDSVSFSVAPEPGAPRAVSFNSAGTKMYMLASFPADVYQYTLSTAWDLSTASYDSVSFSVTSEDTLAEDISFKPDGTKMYMIGEISDSVYQYTLSTAWDLSTASYDSVSFSVASEDTAPRALTFKPDGLKLYVSGIQNDKVYQYTLLTAWDLSTASYDSVSLDVLAEAPGASSLFFKPDGVKLYVLDALDDDVHQYSTGKPYQTS